MRMGDRSLEVGTPRDDDVSVDEQRREGNHNRSRYESKPTNRKDENSAPNPRSSTLSHERVLWERFLEIVFPCSQVGICVRPREPDSTTSTATRVKKRRQRSSSLRRENKKRTHFSIYDCVGKLSGSQPMLMLSGSWYILT